MIISTLRNPRGRILNPGFPFRPNFVSRFRNRPFQLLALSGTMERLHRRSLRKRISQDIAPAALSLTTGVGRRKDLISYNWSIDRLTHTRSSRPLSQRRDTFALHAFPTCNVPRLQLRVIYICALCATSAINSGALLHALLRYFCRR